MHTHTHTHKHRAVHWCPFFFFHSLAVLLVNIDAGFSGHGSKLAPVVAEVLTGLAGLEPQNAKPSCSGDDGAGVGCGGLGDFVLGHAVMRKFSMRRFESCFKSPL
jgi:hypothetical protein